eukprot:403342155
MSTCAKCCKATARFTGLFFAKTLVISASVFFLLGAVFLFWIGGYYSKHAVATELGINQQIMIGCVSLGILLFFNFMLVLPIIFTADKIFSRLFTIMSMFFSLAFLAFAIVVFKGRSYIYDYVQQECGNPIGVFGDYDRMHQIAEHYMCTTQCPCNVDSTLWPEADRAKMVTSPTGITTISDCVPYQNYAKAEGLDYDSTISTLEKYFDCSGVCFISKYNSFTDVKKGPPAGNCVDKIDQYVANYSSWIGGLSIAVGLLLLLGVVGSLIIICCIGTKIKITAITRYKYEIMEDNVI